MNPLNQTRETRSRRMAISPRAKAAAIRLGIDPITIRGSGPDGRILEADVLSFRPQAGVQIAPARQTKVSTMRQIIAQRTAGSFATVPHFYLRTELDATALLALRASLLEQIESDAGVRLTLTDLLLKATGLALRACPAANRIWQTGTIIDLPSIDVGMAVGLEDGLIIPIIRNVDRLPLTELARVRAELTNSAKAGRLTAEQTQGGATTLSNLGNSVVDDFSAIISPPQSSILAIGRVVPRPFVVKDSLSVRPTLKLCLSVDHRVLDGAPAAEYLGRLASLLENPEPLKSRRASPRAV